MTGDVQRPRSHQPSGTGALRPKARLLRTLGSELISSDKVALIELVKNSYDADASVAIIRLQGPLEQEKGRIDVWDDGQGMDVETLQRSWLDIATETKRRQPRSQGGRRVLGEKGIGRLAASRLGQEMMLTTRMARADEVKLLIDWRDFDRKDAYLDEIEVAWEVGPPDVFSDSGAAVDIFSTAGPDTFHHGRGTVVQIYGLSRSWDRADLLELRTALTRLIRPRPRRISNLERKEETKADFLVILDLVDVEEGLQDLAGPIDPSPDLHTPHYSLSGSVDAHGSATLHYAQQHPLLEEDIGVKKLWTNEKRCPKAGPFDFEINVWDREDAAIRRTLQETHASPSTTDFKGFRDTLSDLAGVSIYRDGFRVLPFGEKGDDWLGLDLRRVQTPTRHVSNNQIIGHIFIGADTNDGLKDQSNREGILEGPPYSDLQTLVKAALTELETRRYTARRPQKGSRRSQGPLFQRFDLKEIRTTVTQSYPGDKGLIRLIDEKDRHIQEGVSEVQNVLSRYSRLATLGALVDRVLHDGRTAVAKLKNIARFGTRDLTKDSYSNDKKIKIALDAMSGTTDQAELLSSLFRQISPFGGRKRGRPREISTSDVIDKAFALLQHEADDQGVKLERGGEPVSVKVDEAELLTVLVNLIQNAIYWSSTGANADDRRVLVVARLVDDSSLSLVVSDSGPGVAEDVREHIFDPYFSTRPEGVGLGLSIAGNLVENIYEGELLLVEDGPLDGATFEAIFRRRIR